MTKEVYTYEYAHRMCHPETCTCPKNFRILKGFRTIDWADTEAEAKSRVKLLKEKSMKRDSSAPHTFSVGYGIEQD